MLHGIGIDPCRMSTQMTAHPWPVRHHRGWGPGGPGPADTELLSTWLFNDPLTGQWTIALDYQAQPSQPIYQVQRPDNTCRNIGQILRSGILCITIASRRLKR